MARTRKPWFHSGTGYWCCKIQGKRVYLDRDQAKARRKLNKLAAEERRPASDWHDRPLPDLVDEFLADVKGRRAERTHADYSWTLARALSCLPAGLTVGDVRKLHLAHLERALLALGDGPTTIFKVLHAVQRVYRWAVEHDLLEQSPLTGYRKPRPRQRSRILERGEFRTMLRVSDAPFRRFLFALRWTGCRPYEVRRLDWSHVDLTNGVWILSTHKTITTQEQPRPRIIALDERALRLCHWLARRGTTGRVFRNSKGKPWTASALDSRLRRLKARAGFTDKGGESVVLYTCRHTYATEGIGRVSDTELAELLGHSTTKTTRRYVHFNTARLREIAKKAAGG